MGPAYDWWLRNYANLPMKRVYVGLSVSLFISLTQSLFWSVCLSLSLSSLFPLSLFLTVSLGSAYCPIRPYHHLHHYQQRSAKARGGRDEEGDSVGVAFR